MYCVRSCRSTLTFHFLFVRNYNNVLYCTTTYTSNNVERRLGFSVIVLYLLVASKAWAVYQFYRIRPRAGQLLAATLTWLIAAAALETRTWQINPDPDTGRPEPLYPAKAAKWKTRFVWEAEAS